MKVWKNVETGKFMGYQADFPNGLGGCVLAERDEAVAPASPVESVVLTEEDERSALAAQYEAKFGKVPHPATKIETLRDRVVE